MGILRCILIETRKERKRNLHIAFTFLTWREKNNNEGCEKLFFLSSRYNCNKSYKIMKSKKKSVKIKTFTSVRDSQWNFASSYARFLIMIFFFCYPKSRFIYQFFTSVRGIFNIYTINFNSDSNGLLIKTLFH